MWPESCSGAHGDCQVAVWLFKTTAFYLAEIASLSWTMMLHDPITHLNWPKSSHLLVANGLSNKLRWSWGMTVHDWTGEQRCDRHSLCISREVFGLAIPGALLKQLKLASQRTITRWGTAEFSGIQRENRQWMDQTDRWFNLSLEWNPNWKFPPESCCIPSAFNNLHLNLWFTSSCESYPKDDPRLAEVQQSPNNWTIHGNQSYSQQSTIISCIWTSGIQVLGTKEYMELRTGMTGWPFGQSWVRAARDWPYAVKRDKNLTGIHYIPMEPPWNHHGTTMETTMETTIHLIPWNHLTSPKGLKGLKGQT